MNTAVNVSRSKWWLAGAVLLVCMPASALWKWRDAKGSVQYTDRPPPAEVADKDILQRPPGARRAEVLGDAPTSPTPDAPKPPLSVKVSTADKSLEAKKQDQERAAQAKEKAEAEQAAKARGENCARAKTYRQTLSSGVRVARSNDKGETEVLNDDDRAQELNRTQEIIRRDCP